MCKIFCTEQCLVKGIAVGANLNNYTTGGQLLIKALAPEIYWTAKTAVECLYLLLKCYGKIHICFPVVVLKTAYVTANNKHYRGGVLAVYA